MKCKSPGYTLIEILVGLTIVGLIFAFGYVNFREFSRRQALTGQARNLKGDLRIAQEQALAGKKPDDIFCNSPNTLNGYFFRVTGAQSYQLEASCSAGNVITKTVNLPADVSLSSPSPNPILFKILGQGTNVPASTTLTLTQAGTGYTRDVVVTVGGEIK